MATNGEKSKTLGERFGIGFMTMSISSLLMAVWFIVYGICGLLLVPQSGLILAVLALIVGILILVRK